MERRRQEEIREKLRLEKEEKLRKDIIVAEEPDRAAGAGRTPDTLLVSNIGNKFADSNSVDEKLTLVRININDILKNTDYEMTILRQHPDMIASRIRLKLIRTQEESLMAKEAVVKVSDLDSVNVRIIAHKILSNLIFFK